MRVWLMAAALLIPAGGLAGPVAPGPSVKAPPSYVILPPAPVIDNSTGWSWRATVGPPSLDLRPPDRDPLGRPDSAPRDVVAGYVWREQGQSVVIGYDGRAFDHSDDRGASPLFGPRPWRAEPDVFGLTFRVQTPN